MAVSITRHSKERIMERTEGIDSIPEAKKVAKQAKQSGKTINYFQKYPKFFSYLQNKKGQSNECSIRIYRGCIYIWKGKRKALITAHPIPDRYLQEIEEINNQKENKNEALESTVNSLS